MANKKRDQSPVDQLRVKFLQLSDENKQKVQGLMLGLEHAQEVIPPLKGITTVKQDGFVS